MSKGMSLLDLLTQAASRKVLTKKDFGRIMHDPSSTEGEIREALKMLGEADGYENLADWTVWLRKPYPLSYGGLAHKFSIRKNDGSIGIDFAVKTDSSILDNPDIFCTYIITMMKEQGMLNGINKQD